MMNPAKRITGGAQTNLVRITAQSFLLGILLATFVVGASVAAEEREPRVIPVKMREPSGLAWHPLRQSLLVISDEGQLVEFDKDFEVKKRFRLYGDLESVAVQPETGAVFIGDEGNGAVLEYDLERERVVRVMTIDFGSQEDFAEGIRDNQGLEGLTVVRVDDDYRLVGVVERNPARLILLDADVSGESRARVNKAAAADRHEPLRESVRITRSVDVGLLRISGVTAHPDGKSIVMIAVGEQLIRQCDLSGNVMASLTSPGSKPEGIGFLPDGRAVVAHDMKKGALTVLPDLVEQLAARQSSGAAD